MKILYIFPHPDDESFGPAQAIHKQLSDGHEVYLLTLTKGGATKIRHDLRLSIEEMGEVRHKEMLCVEKTLGLTGMEVLDLVDSGLKELDPRDIEDVVKNHIRKIRPDVLVTYAVHGVSGFHDHLVTHAVVKRVFCEMKAEEFSPTRLALFTLGSEWISKDAPFKLQTSTDDEIDCVVEVTDENSQKAKDALKCYATYKDTIQKTGVDKKTHLPVYFEFFQENFTPPLSSITENL